MEKHIIKRVYLASPYSSTSRAIRNDRFRAACRAAADIIKAGHVCFSPITHSHHIADYMENHNDSGCWLKQDLSFLDSWADELWVLILDGWQESKGIKAEIMHASGMLPIKYIKGKSPCQTE
jgi:hypothetical protein